MPVSEPAHKFQSRDLTCIKRINLAFEANIERLILCDPHDHISKKRKPKTKKGLVKVTTSKLSGDWNKWQTCHGSLFLWLFITIKNRKPVKLILTVTLS